MLPKFGTGCETKEEHFNSVSSMGTSNRCQWK